ncbi:MAG: acyl-CoA dehydrogenase family protein [Spirochaetota bacterium]|nr:acyl-CoA dehydrogenase family protein [Spirochaetota bacterium]
MADFCFDDLRFILEKYIPWGDIEAVQGKESLLDEYIMTMETVAKWCEEQVEPEAEGNDKDECRLEEMSDGNNRVILPKGITEGHEKLKELGLFCGVTLPEDKGGFDFPLTTFFAYGEIISMADSSLGLTPMLNEGSAQVLVEFANEKIISEYLPRLISGERLCAMGLTEPGAGSDLVVMQTTARPVDTTSDNSERIKELQNLGEVYLLNGSKIFISNGYGDVLALAKVGEGISMFLVYGEDKKVSRIEKKLGIKGSATCELFFDNSPGVLVGELGGGLIPNMLKLMNIARLGVATQALAIGQRAHSFAVDYANERIQFGVPIIEHPPVRQIIYENEINLQATRALTYMASYYFDMREAYKRKLNTFSKDSIEYKELNYKLKKYHRISEIFIPLSKYDASELSNTVAYSSLQVYGGYGFTKEYPMERFYRDARITSIYEGTSQIQIDQVFNETFYFEKLGLINQFKLGDNRTFVETEKNRLFLDNLFDEYKNEIISNADGKKIVLDLLEMIDRMRLFLKESREILFLEARKKEKEEGRRYNSVFQKDYVDIIGAIIKGYLLLKQALISDYKGSIAKSYIERMKIKAEYHKNNIKGGVDDIIGESYNLVMRVDS